MTQDERDALKAMLSGGKHPARKLKRAQILLAADAALGDGAIAAATRASGSTIYPTKRRFVEGNREAALSEEPRPGAARKLTDKEGGTAGGDRLLQTTGGPQTLDIEPARGQPGQAS